ncbi:MAG: GatB/YqeY domain-containing protein [Firmicutes bacterium]|nr:GatB/YqeY domain-containing protein [Bacillota bacterium]
MSLRDRLNEDLKSAMRAHDTVRLSVIRGIKAAILSEETRDQRTTLDDDGIIRVIAKEVKQRQESLPDFERSGRSDLVQQLHQELDILSEYLPAPLSDDEVKALVEEAVAATGAAQPKDMGLVMGWLAPRTRGRADGRLVAELVKERLAGKA